MKRKIFILLVICIAFIAVIMTVTQAEENVPELCVLRHKISLNSKKGSDRIKYLEFGTKLNILSYENDYCKVQDPENDIGYVYTGYIGFVNRRLWLTNDNGTGGVVLSYWPNMKSTDFGYAAGGKRINELALVLYEQDYYWYVVTNEGCSGYIYKYDPNVITYEEYLWRIEQ